MALKFFSGFFGVLGISLLLSAFLSWFFGGLTNQYGGYSRSGQPLNPESLLEVGEPLYTILGIVHWSMILALLLGGWGSACLWISGKLMSSQKRKEL